MRLTTASSLLTLFWLAPISAPAGGNIDKAHEAIAWVDQLVSLSSGIRPEVLRAAIDAAGCAQQQGLIPRKHLLTVIDYSIPSSEPRLWVIDLSSRRLLFHELVAHGRNSGENMTVRFSNKPGSLQTSLGLFVTRDTYVGRNGYSLRLDGLEAGINDRARERAVVIHGASYVSPKASLLMGRLGRSWGCPALRNSVARELIDIIKDGTAVFAYYPDRHWLSTSRFISSCGVNIKQRPPEGDPSGL